MTDDEWESVGFLIEQCWKGEFDDEKRQAYRVFLDKFSATQVVAGLHLLAESGAPFLPEVPEMVQAVRSVAEEPVPGWAEVWKNILTPMKRGWPEQQALDYLNEVHPIVARFVVAQGYETLKRTPFFDEQYGSLRIKELSERWEEFVAVARERAAHGRALEAAGQRAGIGPTRLDQHALLERLGAPKELPEASG